MVQAVRKYLNIVNIINNRKKLFISIYILSVLLIIFAPFVGKALIFIATFLFVFSLVSLPNIYSYSLLYGLFPFASIYKLSPESFSFFTICEILFFLKIIFELLIKQKSIKCNTTLLIGLTFTVLHIILFSTQIPYLDIVKLIVHISLVAYYFRTISSYEDRKQSCKMIGYCFSISMLIMMLVSLNNTYINLVSEYLRIIKYDFAGNLLIRNSGLMGDPNYCSMAIMVSLTFITVLYRYKWIKYEFWLLAIPLFLLGFTTLSKAYFLTAIVFLIILLFLVLFPKHKKYLAILLCIIVASVIPPIMRGQIEIINQILYRFSTTDLYTGRDMLAQRYLGYIFSNIDVLFFGKGFDAPILTELKLGVHNLYIELLYRLGIIGSIFFIITIISCFPKKTTKGKLVNYIPAIFIFVMYVFLAGVRRYELFYYILLSGITILNIKEFKEECKKNIMK